MEVTALSDNVLVVIVCVPEVKDTAEEIAVEQPELLYKVTVAPSLKVNATVGLKFVVLGDVDCTLTDEKLGASESNVLDSCVAAVLLLPAASCADAAATLTVTAPCADGVTFTV
jgi:hypothetical protein